MNTIDIVLLFFLVICFGVGFKFGIINIFFSLFSIVSAFLFSRTYGEQLTLTYFGNSFIIKILIYIIVFFIISYIVFILGKLISKLAKVFFLGIFDRISGGLLMILVGGSIIFLILKIVPYQNSRSKINKSIESSKIVKLINGI